MSTMTFPLKSPLMLPSTLPSTPLPSLPQVTIDILLTDLAEFEGGVLQTLEVSKQVSK